MNPLLSICIPTYNRANRLRVMLQALLPQVVNQASKVEVLISDNASMDRTIDRVDEAKSVHPLRYSRNASNLGAIANILKLTTELARGEFVWVLGDDDLLLPNALSMVLDTLQAQSNLDAIYFNFYCADYAADWPDDAVGGYRGPYGEPANPEFGDRSIAQWHELIRPESSMCTQVYAHVVRRAMWKDYWRERQPRALYSDVYGTYPHTCMLAETMMHGPSYYVGEPVLTVFNGGESWTSLKSELALLRYPELLRLYQKLGLSSARLSDCALPVFQSCEPFLADILRGDASLQSPTIRDYLRANWRFPGAWKALARASQAAGKPWLVSRLLSAAITLRRAA
jgi:hypothetical protein